MEFFFYLGGFLCVTSFYSVACVWRFCVHVVVQNWLQSVCQKKFLCLPRNYLFKILKYIQSVRQFVLSLRFFINLGKFREATIHLLLSVFDLFTLNAILCLFRFFIFIIVCFLYTFSYVLKLVVAFAYWFQIK